MTDWESLLKTLSPTAGALPAPTTQPNLYDWSSLPYYGLMQNFGAPGGWDSGSSQDPTTDKTYANVVLPGQKYSAMPNYAFQDTFGGHSGITQNSDGTFNALRRIQGNTDKSQYEQTSYKLSDDGKSLVPVDNQWTPITIKDTGLLESIGGALKDIAPLALGVAGAWGVGSLLANAGLGAGTAAGAGSGATAGSGIIDLGGAMASGIPAWDAAAAAAGLPLEYAAAPILSGINTAATNPALIESAVGTPGYGASSAGAGGGAGVLTGATAGMLPGVSGPTVGGTTPTVPNPATAGSGVLGSLGDWLMKNPMLAGALLGKVAGGGFSGSGGSGSRTAAPLPADYKPLTYGTPSGIFGKYDPTAEELAAPGSQGMFANYLKRELTRGG